MSVELVCSGGLKVESGRRALRVTDKTVVITGFGKSERVAITQGSPENMGPGPKQTQRTHFSMKSQQRQLQRGRSAPSFSSRAGLKQIRSIWSLLGKK